jgi:hypothetical protein
MREIGIEVATDQAEVSTGETGAPFYIGIYSGKIRRRRKGIVQLILRAINIKLK